MRGVYNLIRIIKGEEWKITFKTRYGSYEYKVMPFRLINILVLYQSLVNDILRKDLDKKVIIYLNNILIYLKTYRQYRKDVKGILDKLLDRKLKLELEKCAFYKKEVQFLGYIINIEGIQIDLEKVKAIVEQPILIGVKELQSFLGIVNFNRKFIKGYFKIIQLLTQLI